jgi:3-isopropylmalate/(R)-2-methylmalate dehydratase large subunit
VLSPKDLILHLIGDPYFREEHWRESPTDTCIIEFGGPGLDQWNVDELSRAHQHDGRGRPDDRHRRALPPIVDFLRERRGIDVTDLFVHPDPGAEYARTLRRGPRRRCR